MVRSMVNRVAEACLPFQTDSSTSSIFPSRFNDLATHSRPAQHASHVAGPQRGKDLPLVPDSRWNHFEELGQGSGSEQEEDGAMDAESVMFIKAAETSEWDVRYEGSAHGNGRGMTVSESKDENLALKRYDQEVEAISINVSQ